LWIGDSAPDRVDALGGFHTGRMVTDDDRPHLLAPRVRGEVCWGHADPDQSMTPENIATLDQAMDDAGVRHTTELYEGARHGYAMSHMGAHNEAAAERLSRHYSRSFNKRSRGENNAGVAGVRLG
jgi:carboxymethylenebutenolidase